MNLIQNVLKQNECEKKKILLLRTWKEEENYIKKLELEILSLKEEIQNQQTEINKRCNYQIHKWKTPKLEKKIRLLDSMRNPEIAGNHTIGLCHRCASLIMYVPLCPDSLVCAPGCPTN